MTLMWENCKEALEEEISISLLKIFIAKICGNEWILTEIEIEMFVAGHKDNAQPHSHAIIIYLKTFYACPFPLSSFVSFDSHKL